MAMPKTKVCEYCHFVTTVKHKKCPCCGNENKPKETKMKWTYFKTARMMDLIFEHKKLSDGFMAAAKKLKCSKSAVSNRYYKVMKMHCLTNAGLSDLDRAKINSIFEKPSTGDDDQLQKILSDPSVYNYTSQVGTEKPITFIEKVKAFFK